MDTCATSRRAASSRFSIRSSGGRQAIIVDTPGASVRNFGDDAFDRVAANGGAVATLPRKEPDTRFAAAGVEVEGLPGQGKYPPVGVLDRSIRPGPLAGQSGNDADRALDHEGLAHVSLHALPRRELALQHGHHRLPRPLPVTQVGSFQRPVITLGRHGVTPIRSAGRKKRRVGEVCELSDHANGYRFPAHDPGHEDLHIRRRPAGQHGNPGI